MKSILKLPIFILAIIFFSFAIIASILSALELFQNLSFSTFNMLTLVLSYTMIILAGLFFSICLKPPYILQIAVVIFVYLCVAFILGGLTAVPKAALRMITFSMTIFFYQWWKKRMKTN